jgi:zinc protease
MRSKLLKHLISRMGAAICVLITLQPINAQPTPVPETQELLNGLKILFWPQPGNPDVLVKLRIHSGSAFDLSGKAGEMALLGDILFPDPETLEFFSEQMGGKLTVSVNYDSITITMLGKAEQLNNILEVLRNAILSTQLTPEVVAKVREARIKMVKDSTVSPAVVADRAVASRLFGTFPYGRPSGGSPEELSKVDRADLMMARERFVNSNNATLAIVGGVTQSRAIRTLKQLFGPWRRSEQIVPSTFTAPKSPDPRVLIVNLPSPTSEVRLAVRGVSRSDQQFYAALLLARIAQYRWQ